nr:MAG TPA: hypothetical protein [Caudoviricetes sp.]
MFFRFVDILSILYKKTQLVAFDVSEYISAALICFLVSKISSFILR